MSHEEKVQKISGYLKTRVSSAPLVFVKRGVSHQVPKPGVKVNAEALDLSELHEILEIDAENKTCTAEPGVTFYDLVRATLKYNLVPFVVPELKTITIGGAVAGCSIEGMSYKCGGFHDNALEYEIITAAGDVLVCNLENENKDIFEMVHGTFGTLGIISKLKFKLTEAKQFVHMKYESVTTLNEYKRKIWEHYEKKDADFVDGIIHGRDKYVLCVGNFVDNAPYVSNFDWMNVFYKTTARREEDYLRTIDYFFRYDADCHWIARNYGLENPVLRFLLGKFFFGSTKMLLLAKKLGFIFKNMKPDVVVDVFVPFSKLDSFFEFYNREFDYYPLWVVPYKIARRYPWINGKLFDGVDDELFIDLAVYGFKQRGGKDYYRLMEEALMRIPGIKTLISHNSYTEEEFWSVWNKENYSKVKSVTDPKNIFRDLYSKTHPQAGK